MVIGMTEPKGALSWFDPDDQIFIPVSTAQKRVFGMNHIQSIDVQASKIEDLEVIKEDITQLLRIRHNIANGKENIIVSLEKKPYKKKRFNGLVSL